LTGMDIAVLRPQILPVETPKAPTASAKRETVKA